jgi:hypothetical protein
MGQLYGDGTGNKLEAAKQAIENTNALISTWANGSRFGLLTYVGGQNPENESGTYAVGTTNQLAWRPLRGGLTDNISTFNDKLNQITTPHGSTPTYHGLDFSEVEMGTDNSNGRLATFILLTDGVPTISRERYSFNDSDVQGVSIKDGQGGFRSEADVRIDGGPGGPSGHYNGEPLADVMAEIVSIKSNQPDYTFHAIGIQGQEGNTFNPEILEYVAFTGGGIFAAPNDLSTLTQALEQAVQDTACNTQPTVTQLASFETTANQEGDEILVTWETTFEVDTEGFNLYRTTDSEATRSSGDVKLNEELIPSQAGANGEGALYEWPDQDIEPNTTYHYLLEEIKSDGESTLYEEEIPSNENMLFLPILLTR